MNFYLGFEDIFCLVSKLRLEAVSLVAYFRRQDSVLATRIPTLGAVDD
jgi:hypothetical protein